MFSASNTDSSIQVRNFSQLPVSLVVRIRRSHRRGRGLIPRQGGTFFGIVGLINRVAAICPKKCSETDLI